MKKRYRICEDIVSRRMGDEMVVVHLGTNRIHTLNPTAARLWELLEAGHSLGEIRSVLLDEFEVDESSVAREVGALLSELEGSELIRSGDDG